MIVGGLVWFGPLTREHAAGSVLLGVAFILRRGTSGRLGLISTQSFPLLLQTVLILQVILHVRLRKRKRKRKRKLVCSYIKNQKIINQGAEVIVEIVCGV